MAISLVEFKVGEATASASATTASFAATQAGDVLICAGYAHTAAAMTIKTNNNDLITFGRLNGVTTPMQGFGDTYSYVGTIKPTVGSTSVSISNGSATSKLVGVWVVRGMPNPVQDKGVWTHTTGLLNLSGQTGVLGATEEIAVSFCLANAATNSVNTSQTGASGFVLDALPPLTANGLSHQITSATTSIQAAWDVTTGGGDALCATYGAQLVPVWEFVGVSSVVETTTTTHTLTEPTGVQQGDLMVAFISSRIASTTSITLPGGWTRINEQKNNNVLTTTSATPSGMMAYIVRGAAAPSLTFTHPTAPSVAIGRIVAYRGEDTNAPLDTQSSFTTAIATTAVSGAGLTTTPANDLIVVGACGGLAAAWSAFDATDPATSSGTNSVQTANPITGTWQERQDSSTATGSDTSLAIADAIKGPPGATGNLTATASVSAAQVIVSGAFKRFPGPLSLPLFRRPRRAFTQRF